MNDPRVEVAVGAIVRREETLLLVRRGRAPGGGQWSIPGGRVAFAESLTDAVAREVLEETALRVRVERFAGWVERIGQHPAPYHYVILDFFATEIEPRSNARAGDDATAVQWAPLASLADVDLVVGLADFLTSVGVRGGSPG